MIFIGFYIIIIMDYFLESESNMKNINTKTNSAIIPEFAGTSKSGCKIYKGTPHIINKSRNSLIFANVVSIALCVLCMVTCVIVSVVAGVGNQSIKDFCNLVFTFSIVAIILTLCAFSPMLISFNKTMSKIYLCITHEGIEGITKNQNNKFVYYSLTYDELDSIVYTMSDVVIKTTSGELLIYDVFYNPHEIYKTIFQMSGELERLAM